MKILVLVFISLFAFIAEAHAQLIVNKSTIELTESSPRSNIRITNPSADTLYVNLDIDELLNPAVDESLRTPIDLLADPKILVLPQQMVLEPGQTKIVRIITTSTQVNTDQVYRLNVVPFAGKPLMGESEEKSVGVKILLGYKLLVLVRPEQILPNIEYTRLANSLMFNNAGNTSVLLREIRRVVLPVMIAKV